MERTGRKRGPSGPETDDRRVGSERRPRSAAWNERPTGRATDDGPETDDRRAAGEDAAERYAMELQQQEYEKELPSEPDDRVRRTDWNERPTRPASDEGERRRGRSSDAAETGAEKKRRHVALEHKPTKDGREKKDKDTRNVVAIILARCQNLSDALTSLAPLLERWCVEDKLMTGPEARKGRPSTALDDQDERGGTLAGFDKELEREGADARVLWRDLCREIDKNAPVLVLGSHAFGVGITANVSSVFVGGRAVATSAYGDQSEWPAKIYWIDQLLGRGSRDMDGWWYASVLRNCAPYYPLERSIAGRSSGKTLFVVYGPACARGLAASTLDRFGVPGIYFSMPAVTSKSRLPFDDDGAVPATLSEMDTWLFAWALVPALLNTRAEHFVVVRVGSVPYPDWTAALRQAVGRRKNGDAVSFERLAVGGCADRRKSADDMIPVACAFPRRTAVEIVIDATVTRHAARLPFAKFLRSYGARNDTKDWCYGRAIPGDVEPHGPRTATARHGFVDVQKNDPAEYETFLRAYPELNGADQVVTAATFDAPCTESERHGFYSINEPGTLDAMVVSREDRLCFQPRHRWTSPHFFALRYAFYNAEAADLTPTDVRNDGGECVHSLFQLRTVSFEAAEDAGTNARDVAARELKRFATAAEWEQYARKKLEHGMVSYAPLAVSDAIRVYPLLYRYRPPVQFMQLLAQQRPPFSPELVSLKMWLYFEATGWAEEREWDARCEKMMKERLLPRARAVDTYWSKLKHFTKGRVDADGNSFVIAPPAVQEVLRTLAKYVDISLRSFTGHIRRPCRMQGAKPYSFYGSGKAAQTYGTWTGVPLPVKLDTPLDFKECVLVIGDSTLSKFQQAVELQLSRENRQVVCLCLSGKGVEAFAAVLQHLPPRFTKVLWVYGGNDAFQDLSRNWTDAEIEDLRFLIQFALWAIAARPSVREYGVLLLNEECVWENQLTEVVRSKFAVLKALFGEEAGDHLVPCASFMQLNREDDLKMSDGIHYRLSEQPRVLERIESAISKCAIRHDRARPVTPQYPSMSFALPIGTSDGDRVPSDESFLNHCYFDPNTWQVRCRYCLKEQGKPTRLRIPVGAATIDVELLKRAKPADDASEKEHTAYAEKLRYVHKLKQACAAHVFDLAHLGKVHDRGSTPVAEDDGPVPIAHLLAHGDQPFVPPSPATRPTPPTARPRTQQDVLEQICKETYFHPQTRRAVCRHCKSPGSAAGSEIADVPPCLIEGTADNKAFTLGAMKPTLQRLFLELSSHCEADEHRTNVANTEPVTDACAPGASMRNVFLMCGGRMHEMPRADHA